MDGEFDNQEGLEAEDLEKDPELDGDDPTEDEFEEDEM